MSSRTLLITLLSFFYNFSYFKFVFFFSFFFLHKFIGGLRLSREPAGRVLRRLSRQGGGGVSDGSARGAGGGGVSERTSARAGIPAALTACGPRDPEHQNSDASEIPLKWT